MKEEYPPVLGESDSRGGLLNEEGQTKSAVYSIRDRNVIDVPCESPSTTEVNYEAKERLEITTVHVEEIIPQTSFAVSGPHIVEKFPEVEFSSTEVQVEEILPNPIPIVEEVVERKSIDCSSHITTTLVSEDERKRLKKSLLEHNSVSNAAMLLMLAFVLTQDFSMNTILIPFLLIVMKFSQKEIKSTALRLLRFDSRVFQIHNERAVEVHAEDIHRVEFEISDKIKRKFIPELKVSLSRLYFMSESIVKGDALPNVGNYSEMLGCGFLCLMFLKASDGFTGFVAKEVSQKWFSYGVQSAWMNFYTTIYNFFHHHGSGASDELADLAKTIGVRFYRQIEQLNDESMSIFANYCASTIFDYIGSEGTMCSPSSWKGIFKSSDKLSFLSNANTTQTKMLRALFIGSLLRIRDALGVTQLSTLDGMLWEAEKLLTQSSIQFGGALYIMNERSHKKYGVCFGDSEQLTMSCHYNNQEARKTILCDSTYKR